MKIRLAQFFVCTLLCSTAFAQNINKTYAILFNGFADGASGIVAIAALGELTLKDNGTVELLSSWCSSNSLSADRALYQGTYTIFGTSGKIILTKIVGSPNSIIENYQFELSTSGNAISLQLMDANTITVATKPIYTATGEAIGNPKLIGSSTKFVAQMAGFIGNSITQKRSDLGVLDFLAGNKVAGNVSSVKNGIASRFIQKGNYTIDGNRIILQLSGSEIRNYQLLLSSDGTTIYAIGKDEGEVFTGKWTKQ